MSKGLMVIISAPSGAGKTSILKRILAEIHGSTFSVSHTTRAPRSSEIEGRDYYFIDDRKFDRMISEDQFAEWAVVHGFRYGTSRTEIDRLRKSGSLILFEVDYQGGINLKNKYPEAVSIFIVPPSVEVLRNRLIKRGTETPDQINLRIQDAAEELKFAKYYDFIVENNDIEKAVNDVKAIIRTSHGRIKWFESE
jgi:guanylate kinase